MGVVRVVDALTKKEDLISLFIVVGGSTVGVRGVGLRVWSVAKALAGDGEDGR